MTLYIGIDPGLSGALGWLIDSGHEHAGHLRGFVHLCVGIESQYSTGKKACYAFIDARMRPVVLMDVENEQVFDAVVGGDTVDVVNQLRWLKNSADGSFNNETVLRNKVLPCVGMARGICQNMAAMLPTLELSPATPQGASWARLTSVMALLAARRTAGILSRVSPVSEHCNPTPGTLRRYPVATALLPTIRKQFEVEVVVKPFQRMSIPNNRFVHVDIIS